MLRTQIYLPEKQIRQLKKIATEDNISLSEVIRKLVEEKLTMGETKKTRTKNAGKWLLSLAKISKKLKVKGPKDLATNIDKYLYGGK